MALAAGLTVSVQETTGSDIAFAAIVHMGQTVPAKFLRSVLECRDMVSVKTADGDFEVVDGRVTAPEAPGLGITVRLDVLGDPVATYG
jgi:L-alanine-DL-glutamate epimerase-like enolase superfamily enzyme